MNAAQQHVVITDPEIVDKICDLAWHQSISRVEHHVIDAITPYPG